jgi:hypothetical protein
LNYGNFLPLIIAAVILICGIVGGYASFLSTDAGDKKTSPLPNIWLGIVASFVVPLFLSLIQSQLVLNIFLENGTGSGNPTKTVDLGKAGDLFELAGFCLVAAFSSRAFMESVTKRLLALDRDVRRLRNEVATVGVTAQGAEAAAQEAETTAEGVAEAVENADPVASQDDPPEPVPSSHSTAPPRLSDAEKIILETLWSKPRLLRTPGGLVRDAGVSRIEVLRLLGSLMEKGLVTKLTQTRTGRALYRRSRAGVLLSEKLFGQSPRGADAAPISPTPPSAPAGTPAAGRSPPPPESTP